MLLIGSFSYLQVTMTCMRAGMSSQSWLDSTTGFHGNRKCYNLKNGVATFSQLFLMGFFSYLQVMMTYIRAWLSLKFGQIRLLVSMATDRVTMGKTASSRFLKRF